jgi:two-component system cell cycle sensor histidine kinase/response regulator CckA
VTPEISDLPADPNLLTEAIRARREMEAELTRTQRSLAARVAARTAALRKTNEQLYSEILERRKAERSLRAAERKYRRFFENSVEGAYQSTAEGQYLSVNPALARLYGYDSPADMMSTIANIARDVYVDSDMRRQFQERVERDGEVQNLEYRVRQRGGRIIWISENARVARNRLGKVLYYEGTIRNITRSKEAEAQALRLEEQLLQLQKMEAIGTLASGIAHDFNNILSAIIGHTELAQDSVPRGEDADSHLNEVLGVTQRAKRLVGQILAFSRQTPSERTLVPVGALCQEVALLLRATIPPTIEIRQELTAGNDQTIADPAQLHQVLLNLCTNAVHAMGQKAGTLTVRLENTLLGGPESPSVGHTKKGPYLKLTVADTGHGIPLELIGRVYEPFFTTKPVGEGTGLGLSVVHGIIKSHGGEIQVASNPGSGTTFTIYLPAAAETALA